MSDMRLAILDSDSGFVRVLVKRASDLGWQYRRLEAPPRTEDFIAMRVNALVVDLALLGPGAWEFIERVSAALPGLGIVICTGRSSVAQRVRGLRLGADDWVTKPCHPEEVLARVEAVVRRRKRASARVDTGPLVAGELEIRADQFQAFVRATSVDLTRREFEVLQLLAQAKGKVLQREEIYQAVWGYTMAHGDRSVDVFVRKVRQKLEKVSPDWNYIHTHFGVGYRFDPERRDDAGDADPLGSEAPEPEADGRPLGDEPEGPISVSRPESRIRCWTSRRRSKTSPPRWSRASYAATALREGMPRASRRRGVPLISASVASAVRPTPMSVRRARLSAGGRVGPCASDATTRDEAVGEQLPGGAARLLAVAAGQRERVQLGERARLQLVAQPGRGVQAGVGAALGVRDEHAEAALAQLGRRLVEVGVDAVERRLDQHPAPAGRTVREQLQLALAQPGDHVVPELAAAAHLERDRGGGERRAHLQHARVHLDGVRQPEVGADVRRGDHGRGAVGHGRPGQLEALVHVRGAVVDPGQQMEVEIDGRHRTQSIDTRGRDPRDASVTRVLGRVNCGDCHTSPPRCPGISELA